MKNKIGYIFLVLVLLVSCTKKITPSELDKLNGYWEIVAVKGPEGNEKEYSVNTTVEYIEFKNGKGFRQKMVPQFNGKYQSNGIKESLILLNNKEKTILKCQTEYADWTEEIIEISDEGFRIKNSLDIIYTYKKYEPITVSHE